MRHTVCLVQDHQLQLGDVPTVRMLRNFALGKLLYFIADYLDTSFVTSVEFEDSLSVEVGSE